jgi:hypothetical protein
LLRWDGSVFFGFGPRLIQLNAALQNETEFYLGHLVERGVIKAFLDEKNVINRMGEG